MVVGIIGLLAWNIFFVDWDEPGIAKPGSKVDEKPLAQGASAPATETSPAEERGQADAGGGEEARTLIAEARQAAEPPQAAEFFAKAEEYSRSGKKADAYLLHFYLVKQGHGPSAMLLAEMADPSFRDPKTSFLDAPDFTQAHKWYVQALILGQEQAEKRLTDLKLRVKAAAAGGDENARRLLVGW